MKPTRPVGIVGYGAYVPRFRVAAAEIARVWGDDGPLPVQAKAVPSLDEDTITMSIEAARNAIRRAGIDPARINAVWVGTETKPYTVKPSSTVVAEAVGATPQVSAADFEFACKAGSEALQAGIAYVGSGMADYVMAIGVDTAQGRPGDHLEYSTGAGGAAMIVGPAEESLALLEGSYSFVTDTPDFFRRAGQKYPVHGHRFTGEPAYFRHSIAAARALLAELGARPEDYAHVVFHQPNCKFPVEAARACGFREDQWKTGLLSPLIGNTYAGSSILGLAAVLDNAQPGERVLMVSFGSGAGSDAFSFRVTPLLAERRGRAPRVMDYVARAKHIDYAIYARYSRRYDL